jgi:hypothetical protein
MARPKIAGDDQAAAELERMAEKLDRDAEYYAANMATWKNDRPSWATDEQYNENITRDDASVRAFQRAARDLRRRASRLRNGTAGR